MEAMYHATVAQKQELTPAAPFGERVERVMKASLMSPVSESCALNLDSDASRAGVKGDGLSVGIEADGLKCRVGGEGVNSCCTAEGFRAGVVGDGLSVSVDSVASVAAGEGDGVDAVRCGELREPLGVRKDGELAARALLIAGVPLPSTGIRKGLPLMGCPEEKIWITCSPEINGCVRQCRCQAGSSVLLAVEWGSPSEIHCSSHRCYPRSKFALSASCADSSARRQRGTRRRPPSGECPWRRTR